MGLIGGDYEDLRISETEVPSAGKSSGQRIRVGVVERDNGLVMAKTDTIRSALYDLADTNSTTHTVLLPHGTVICLAAPTAPNVGSYRARFTVTNPKLGKTLETKGSSEAAEVANQIDLLSLAKADKNALAKVTELWEAGEADELMIELGLREAPLEEIETHISGYVTKSGKHVGAYSQIRKSIEKIHPGGSVHFPDGIAVKRGSKGGYIVGTTQGMDKIGGVHKPTLKAATDDVAEKSAALNHPKSIGGRVQHQVDKPSDINQIPNSGDNPKLPGAPHPDDVAARAKKAREGVKLPSRKERAANEKAAKHRNAKGVGGRSRAEADEIRAREGAASQQRFSQGLQLKRSMAGTNHPEPKDWAKQHDDLVNKGRSLKVDGIRAAHAHAVSKGDTKMADRIDRTRQKAEGRSSKSSRLVPENDAAVTDARDAKVRDLVANFRTMHGRSPSAKELKALRKSRANRATADRGGSKNTTPSGLPLPSGVTRRSSSGGPAQVDDPARADHRSKQSDSSFGDVSAKTVEGWSDRILSREIDANPGRTQKDRASLKAMQTEYRRRKTAGANRRGIIGGY